MPHFAGLQEPTRERNEEHFVIHYRGFRKPDLISRASYCPSERDIFAIKALAKRYGKAAHFIKCLGIIKDVASLEKWCRTGDTNSLVEQVAALRRVRQRTALNQTIA